MRRLIILAFALAACAPMLDDSDMVRLEQPDAANRCVAWLLGEDMRPLPRIVYTDEMPWHPDFGFVPAFYLEDYETIVMPRRFNQAPPLMHELAHHYGATEREAESVARRAGDCINFGGV